MQARVASMTCIGFCITVGMALAGTFPAEAKLMDSQVGIASYYAMRFHGRKMADGGVFLAGSNSAASRTLPLGTVVKVTNKENNRTAIVIIRDRGPYAKRRIIDLSPATAGRLGFLHSGRVPVIVSPLGNALGTQYEHLHRHGHALRHASGQGQQYANR